MEGEVKLPLIELDRLRDIEKKYNSISGGEIEVVKIGIFGCKSYRSLNKNEAILEFKEDLERISELEEQKIELRTEISKLKKENEELKRKNKCILF